MKLRKLAVAATLAAALGACATRDDAQLDTAPTRNFANGDHVTTGSDQASSRTNQASVENGTHGSGQYLPLTAMSPEREETCVYPPESAHKRPAPLGIFSSN